MALGDYKPLPEQEAFDIEYWALEEAKLKRMPVPKPFAGQVAYITGAAGGIGRAVAEQVLARDGCVMLVDIDAERLGVVEAELKTRFRRDLIRSAVIDVTVEDSVIWSFERCTEAFGGVDIVVANAGIASSAPIVETSLDMWQSNFRVLSEGYFLTAREAFKSMKGSNGKGGGGSDCLCRLEKRAGGVGQCLGLFFGQGGGTATGALPGAGRRAYGHPRQCRQSRCGIARIEHLDR